MIPRRAFIAGLGAAAAWPLAARPQQPALPLVALISSGSADAFSLYAAAFREGLSENGYAERQNLTVEYHWLEGQYDHLPELLADLIRRRVAVLAVTFNTGAIAAKAATATIPIVFGATEDPVKVGLVASLARPSGNATGVNFFVFEVVAKRLRLLHDFVPKAVRIAVLLNEHNAAGSVSTLRQELQEAASALGLQLQILNASTTGEIDAAFTTLARQHADALFVAPDGFFASRRGQITTLAAVNKIPASFADRDSAAAGGLMSYGTDTADLYRQVGAYTGRVLKGAKPADLPVLQLTKFKFVINLQTARALGIEVPPGLLSIADEVIE
jgi:putative ABC transport system substrate-binding protein